MAGRIPKRVHEQPDFWGVPLREGWPDADVPHAERVIAALRWEEQTGDDSLLVEVGVYPQPTPGETVVVDIPPDDTA